jgi:cytochrome c peroxidase
MVAGPIQPLPKSISLSPAKVALGRRLFHEVRLSLDDTVSCATCHDLSKGGTDRKAHSGGIEGRQGEINAPSVFNTGLHFKLFWDGRADTLEDQIDHPIHNPSEMGSNWPLVVSKLGQDASYRQDFARAYPPDGIRRDSITSAIATFERSLLTPNSRFDRFLGNEQAALTAEEKEGYHLFLEYGCASCHQGVLIGGNMFQTFGVMADYFVDRDKKVTRADLGRFNVTGRASDRYRFKVPSLRNVALTAPYFHDGGADTLEKAVTIMARYQLGRRLTHDETRKIVLFLQTLNGVYEGAPS